jgi:hypothetical protein
MKSITHITKISCGFDSFDLKEVDEIWGFDPKGVFKTHLISFNYESSFLELDEQA